MLRHVVLVSALALSLLALQPSPASAGSALQFGRIQFSPPGSDLPITNAKLNAEYVTIVNNGRQALGMRNWFLSDGAGKRYTFGAFSLESGDRVRVHSGKGTNTGTDLHVGSAQYIWSNTADTAGLHEPRGWLSDSCTWTRAGTGVKQCYRATS